MKPSCVYLPLDIPRFEFDRTDLLSFFDQHKYQPQYEFLQAIDNPWLCYEARAHWLSPTKGQLPGSGWQSEFAKRFPQICDCIESLPFESIQRVYFLEQLKDVKPHRDVSREDFPALGPSTFRCPIINDEPERTFYFRLLKKQASLQSPAFEELERIPQLPSDTQWFGMNNYMAQHGSHLPSPYARKLMLCVWGKVSPPLWQALFERSWQKYQNYSIEWTTA